MAGGGASEDGDIGFQIAPMVDVVFVLLLFFMASAGSQVIEHELNISLPSGKGAANPGAPPTTPMMITITGEGAVQGNGQIFDPPNSKELPLLRKWMKEDVDKFGGKDPVIISPSPDARQERIIDVLNAAAAAGVTKLTFG
ncbi:MAG: biopolymer transporter ExbD [Bacteroidota bacterium]